jgi:hypothetical protein
VNPEDAALDWIVTYLEADAELMSMVSGIAPEVRWGRLASPLVRVDFLGGEDLMVIGLHRIWTNCLFNVRGALHWTGSGQPDRTEVNAIGARLDALLHDAEFQSADLEIHSFREEGLPSLSDVTAQGELWLLSGGLYRMRPRVLAAA